MNRTELLYPTENMYRHHMLLDGMWFFAFEATPGTGWENGIPKDCLVPVPASFSEFFLKREEREFAGNIWYERSVYVSKSWLGEDVFIRLDGVGQRFSAFVNGIEVGRAEDCNIPTTLEITRHLRYGDTNTIVIKVNNILTDTTFPQGEVRTVSGTRRINVSDTNGPIAGGLVKSLHLYSVPNTRILDFDISTLMVSNDKAEIHYTAQVQGNCLVTATLRNRDGKVVATGVGGSATLTVETPHLWSIGDGYLYTIDFEVSRLGKQCDAYSVTFGIRTFVCEKGSFFLNNNRIHLKGWRFGLWDSKTSNQGQVNLLGAKREFVRMKELGANCLLVGPEIISEEILRLAAAEGILVLDQIPYRKPIEKTSKSYTANFSEESNEEKEDYTYLVNGNLPKRDKNCASLVGVTIGPKGFDQKVAESLPESWDGILPKEFRYGRPLAVTVQVGFVAASDIVLDSADIIIIAGQGAFDSGIDANGEDAYESLHRDLLALQGRFPEKPVIAVFDRNDNVHVGTFGGAYSMEEAYDSFVKVLHNAANVKGEILLTKAQAMKLMVRKHWAESIL